MDCLDKLIPPAAIKTHSQFPNPLLFQAWLIVSEANVYFWTGSESTLVFLSKPKNLPWIGIHNFLKSLYSPQMCLHLNLPSLPPRLFLMTCQFYPFMQQLQAVIKCKSQKHIFFQPNCNIVQSFWQRLELASKNEKKKNGRPNYFHMTERVAFLWKVSTQHLQWLCLPRLNWQCVRKSETNAGVGRDIFGDIAIVTTHNYNWQILIRKCTVEKSQNKWAGHFRDAAMSQHTVIIGKF